MAKKILIVDDDPDVVLATRMPLESAGYEVYEAASEEEGMAAVEAVMPDLIVLDVMMDTHTAGFQLAMRLHGPDAKPQHVHIPIVMVTAVHQTTAIRFGPDEDYLPVQAFVNKPIQPKKLLDTVASLLNS